MGGFVVYILKYNLDNNKKMFLLYNSDKALAALRKGEGIILTFLPFNLDEIFICWLLYPFLSFMLTPFQEYFKWTCKTNKFMFTYCRQNVTNLSFNINCKLYVKSSKLNLNKHFSF